MQSIEDFDPTDAYEAIRVLDRELQQSEERLKLMENDRSEVRA